MTEIKFQKLRPSANCFFPRSAITKRQTWSAVRIPIEPGSRSNEQKPAPGTAMCKIEAFRSAQSATIFFLEMLLDSTLDGARFSRDVAVAADDVVDPGDVVVGAGNCGTAAVV